jgi:hypothetical protein
MGKKILFWLVFFILSGNCPVYPQHEHSMPDMEMASMPEMQMGMSGMYGGYSMAREASGTSWQPDSTPLQGIHRMYKDWMLMFHGYADVMYDRQGGKRGDEKTFSSSMAMCMAQRELAKGTFGIRSMVSLDPLMGKSGYPLLFQTGETADGETPLIDRQHPHDFFMELATTYSLPLEEDSSLFVYFGLPGEPALGPPAFMHRFSGMDIPSAPITHHWLDSTHITYGVGTLGYVWKKFKIEGSVFRGREPDQNRWDIESPELDSYSTRLSFNPAKDWALQVSYGYIDSPEQLEPNVDTRRVTASCSYNKSYKDSNWQTTFAWGRNDNLPGRALNGFMIESALRVKNTHTFFSRMERVDKDELFLEDEPLHGKKFTVNKLNLGYLYEFPAWRHMKWGLGNSLDINFVPDDLKSVYGRTPLSYMLFVRVRLD